MTTEEIDGLGASSNVGIWKRRQGDPTTKNEAHHFTPLLAEAIVETFRNKMAFQLHVYFDRFWKKGRKVARAKK